MTAEAFNNTLEGKQGNFLFLSFYKYTELSGIWIQEYACYIVLACSSKIFFYFIITLQNRAVILPHSEVKLDIYFGIIVHITKWI